MEIAGSIRMREQSLSIRQGRSESQTSIQAKAASYRITATAIDGMDVVTIERAAREAVRNIREGHGPALLEVLTYRFRAHSMFDAQLYRDKAEVEAWQARGPFITFTKRYKEMGLMTEDDFQRLQKEALAEVDEAVKFAHESAFESIDEISRFVYAEASP